MTDGEEARRLVAAALEQPIEEIAQAGTLDDVPGWDSLGHMRIVLGLEDRLNRQLGAQEVVAIKSIADIAALLVRHKALASFAEGSEPGERADLTICGASSNIYTSDLTEQRQIGRLQLTTTDAFGNLACPVSGWRCRILAKVPMSRSKAL